MREPGKFRVAQIKMGDPRKPQVFRVLRQALDMLEEINLHPYQKATSAHSPAPPSGKAADLRYGVISPHNENQLANEAQLVAQRSGRTAGR